MKAPFSVSDFLTLVGWALLYQRPAALPAARAGGCVDVLETDANHFTN
jgi:hypothetical protein